MKKRLSFILLIAALHLLFALASICRDFGAHGNYAHGHEFSAPLANLLLSPLYYPLRGVLPASLIAPALMANSLLWGLMAERLVWGRKKVMTRKRAKTV